MGQRLPSLDCINSNVFFSGSVIRAVIVAADTSAHVWSRCQGVRHVAQERKVHAWHWICGYPGAEGSGRPDAEHVGERQVKSSMSVFQTSNMAMLYASSLSTGKYLSTISHGQTVSHPGSRQPTLTLRAPRVSRRADMVRPMQDLQTGSMFRRYGFLARCEMQRKGACSMRAVLARLGEIQGTKFVERSVLMHIRQVKCVGGGARGLGFLFTLRFGYQGSRCLRRFAGFLPFAMPDCRMAACSGVMVRVRFLV